MKSSSGKPRGAKSCSPVGVGTGEGQLEARMGRLLPVQRDEVCPQGPADRRCAPGLPVQHVTGHFTAGKPAEMKGPLPCLFLSAQASWVQASVSQTFLVSSYPPLPAPTVTPPPTEVSQLACSQGSLTPRHCLRLPWVIETHLNLLPFRGSLLGPR